MAHWSEGIKARSNNRGIIHQCFPEPTHQRIREGRTCSTACGLQLVLSPLADQVDGDEPCKRCATSTALVTEATAPRTGNALFVDQAREAFAGREATAPSRAPSREKP